MQRMAVEFKWTPCSAPYAPAVEAGFSSAPCIPPSAFSVRALQAVKTRCSFIHVYSRSLCCFGAWLQGFLRIYTAQFTRDVGDLD
jgi:hypothetical protein